MDGATLLLATTRIEIYPILLQYTYFKKGVKGVLYAHRIPYLTIQQTI